MCIPIDYMDIISLYYLPDENKFTDEDGYVIFDIYRIITPNDVFLFRELQDYLIVKHATTPGLLVEMHWPDDEGDYETDYSRGVRCYVGYD